MAEYTQEQLDALVAEKVSEATKGLYTPDDFQKELTREVDRRVETGIQKGLETQKKKWEEEASLSAEELARKKTAEQLAGLTEKEKVIQKKANQIEAKELLADAGIPKSQYDKFISMLVSENEEATKANVQNFIDVFNSTKTDIETQIKAQLSNVPPPGTGDGSKAVTKEEFNKMPYGEKLKFKQTYPELYKEFIK